MMASLRNARGFTILSQLFALSILTVVVLGLASLATMIVAWNASSKQKTAAFTMAQDAIEDMRRAGYNYTLSQNTTVTDGYGSISGYSMYKRITLTQVNTPGTGIQTVTVTVYWQSDTQSVALSTLLAQ